MSPQFRHRNSVTAIPRGVVRRFGGDLADFIVGAMTEMRRHKVEGKHAKFSAAGGKIYADVFGTQDGVRISVTYYGDVSLKFWGQRVASSENPTEHADSFNERDSRRYWADDSRKTILPDGGLFFGDAPHGHEWFKATLTLYQGRVKSSEVKSIFTLVYGYRMVNGKAIPYLNGT